MTIWIHGLSKVSTFETHDIQTRSLVFEWLFQVTVRPSEVPLVPLYQETGYRC
jgi:hypothetical protein